MIFHYTLALFLFLFKVFSLANNGSSVETVNGSCSTIEHGCADLDFTNHANIQNIVQYDMVLENVIPLGNNTYSLTIHVTGSESIPLKYLYSLKVIGINGPEGRVQLYGKNENAYLIDDPTDFYATFEIYGASDYDNDPCHIWMPNFQIQFEYLQGDAAQYADTWVWGTSTFDLTSGCDNYDNNGNSQTDLPGFYWAKDCEDSCLTSSSISDSTTTETSSGSSIGTKDSFSSSPTGVSSVMSEISSSTSTSIASSIYRSTAALSTSISSDNSSNIVSTSQGNILSVETTSTYNFSSTELMSTSYIIPDGISSTSYVFSSTISNNSTVSTDSAAVASSSYDNRTLSGYTNIGISTTLTSKNSAQFTSRSAMHSNSNDFSTTTSSIGETQTNNLLSNTTSNYVSPTDGAYSTYPGSSSSRKTFSILSETSSEQTNISPSCSTTDSIDLATTMFSTSAGTFTIDHTEVMTTFSTSCSTPPYSDQAISTSPNIPVPFSSKPTDGSFISSNGLPYSTGLASANRPTDTVFLSETSIQNSNPIMMPESTTSNKTLASGTDTYSVPNTSLITIYSDAFSKVTTSSLLIVLITIMNIFI